MLRGIFPAIVTPIKKEEVDYYALENLLNFLIKKEVNGVFVSGTTGEGPLLSIEERKELFKEIVKLVSKKIPVIAQIGGITTKDTIILGQAAVEAGVDATAIVSPYYYKLDIDSLKKHFTEIAKALYPFPVYLYNLPENTRNNITPEIVKLIIEETDNVMGIKDTSEDLQLLENFIIALPSSIDVLVGADGLILPALAVGAKGAISALANALPELCIGIYQDFSSGNWEKARYKQLLLNKVRIMINKMSSISAIKVLLKFRGIDVGDVRLPLSTVSKEQERLLKDFFENYIQKSYGKMSRGVDFEDG